MATLFPYGFTDPVGGNYPSSTPRSAQKSTNRELRWAEWLYQFTGSEAAADVIRLPFGGPTGKFPKGTQVHAALGELFVETDCAVTLTADVGDLDSAAASAAYPNGDAYAVAHDANDADRYCDGVDIGAVGRDVFATGVAIAIPHELQEDAYLTLTFATLSTPTTDGVLRIRIPFFLP